MSHNKLQELVTKALLDRSGVYPPRAIADPPALLVHATPALLAYYLGPDGAVYELDLDSTRGPVRVSAASTIREVYEAAVAEHPELHELVERTKKLSRR